MSAIQMRYQPIAGPEAHAIPADIAGSRHCDGECCLAAGLKRGRFDGRPAGGEMLAVRRDDEDDGRQPVDGCTGRWIAHDAVHRQLIANALVAEGDELERQRRRGRRHDARGAREYSRETNGYRAKNPHDECSDDERGERPRSGSRLRRSEQTAVNRVPMAVVDKVVGVVGRFVGVVGRVLLDPAGSLLKTARRPLLLVGLGARRPVDAEAIRSLCAKRGVPAMVTYKAKGVVPDADLHFAGVFTNGTIERSLVAEADLLLGVGLDPVELIPRPWAYTQAIVHVGPARVDDHHIPFSSQFVSDIPSAMQLVTELLPRSSWDLDAMHEAVVSQMLRLCLPSSRLTAHRVVQIAADAAATQARVTVDAGAHMFPATMLWPVAEPNGMLISNGLSTMGFALPAAIGAATLDHGPVVALTGDGGLLMCAGELLTAARESLHIIVIVFADASLSLIDIKQQHRRLESSGVALGAVDWCAVANGFGAAAHRVETEAELSSAMSRALAHHGPTMIEARIDPSTYAETLHTIRG
jgi:hypothetical protein